MLDRVFDIDSFNILSDNENYYFFRKINTKDYNDIKEGIMEDDEIIKKIRTDLERNANNALYEPNDKISLEEVHDHVKWNHRKDTNCISLTYNANVAATYGRTSYDNKFAMVTIPKKEFKDSNFILSGKFLLEETNKRINKLIEEQKLNLEQINYLNLIDKAASNEELFNILKNYTVSTNKKINFSKFYDYLSLNEKQNLEKNKIIAKLDVIDRRLLSRCSNKSLLESVKFSFTSSEIIHYKSIEENFNIVSPVIIDLISMLQQAKNNGLEEEKISILEKCVLDCAKKGFSLQDGKFGEYSLNEEDYIINENQIEISDIYNLTDGKIPFSKAFHALLFSKNIAKSKLKVQALCELLKEMVNDESFNYIIDEINNKCYVVNPLIASHNSNSGLQLCDSVCIDINNNMNKFSNMEQKKILNYINTLSSQQKKDFIDKNGLDNEKILCSLLDVNNNGTDMNRYYIEIILDNLDFGKIYGTTNEKRVLTKEEKEKLISYLDKANCINMVDSLRKLNYDYSDISQIIINLLLNEGYQELNFIDLSNSSEFKNIIEENKNNISLKVSAIRLDYLLGIRDNDNHVLNSNIVLRDYQQVAVDRIDKIFETKNYAGVVLPTGAGKSFVAITEMLKYKNQNIIYYAPNKEILRQLQRHILKHVLNMDVIPESEEEYYLHNMDLIPPNFVFSSDIDEIIQNALPYFKMCCYQGLTTKDEDFFKTTNAGLIVLDEVHRTGAKEWNEKIKILLKNNPNAKILGITATPIRDVDQQNMIDKLAQLSGTYSEQEIKEKKHMAAEMDLIDAIQQGIVVSPIIVTFDYTLENDERYQLVKKRYEEETNPYKKAENKVIYEEIKQIIENSKDKGIAEIIKEGFKKNNKSNNGRYIIFIPPNSNGEKLSTEQYMKQEIEKIKEYFKGIDENPQIEYLLSNRIDKKENEKALNRFEDESENLKLIFAINMLNEGVHVIGIDGEVMLRPLGAGTKILYYQQLGRCIYSIDPNHELEPSEIPIVFDVYNNYLEQNMDRQVNRHTTISDLERLTIIKEWMKKHLRYPDINSEDVSEAKKAISLKRIQIKYEKYLDNHTYSKHLSDTEIYQIERILEIGQEINLWDYVFGERIIDPKEKELEKVYAFSLTGNQKRIVELFEKSDKLNNSSIKKNTNLRLQDALNVLDVLSEYGFDINNDTIPSGCILQNVYQKIDNNILKYIQKEIDLDPGYEIGQEYNEVKKQFFKKNVVFNDYDISSLRKMGIFENDDSSFSINDENGFIVHGPTKFVNLNIYTGTYYDENGFDINGYDEMYFQNNNSYLNKYNFDREGYYYQTTDAGQHINTEQKFNPYGFDIKGDYWQLQQDGTYKNFGKINPYGFDIDGIFYKYNEQTKSYVKTKQNFDDRGFDIDGLFSSTGERRGIKKYDLIYSDEVTRNFDNVEYTGYLSGGRVVFKTNLPYDLYYFDREGYYYELDKNGNRVKTNRKYNENNLDCDGYYWELQEDGSRIKTDRKYGENNYSLEGYYYKLDEKGNRVNTNLKENPLGFNNNGLKIVDIIKRNNYKQKYLAFDEDGYCYEYIKRKYIKLEPETKISKNGFDINLEYHELLPDGTRSIQSNGSKYDEHGFDITRMHKDRINSNYPMLDENFFDQDGYYWQLTKLGYREKTESKVNELGFNIDHLYEYEKKDGTKILSKYNEKFFTMDGFYCKKIQEDDGTIKRVKTRRKTDYRGFDIYGNHYDVYVNKNTNEFVYKNKTLCDKYNFDADGVYYELPSIINNIGEKRYLSTTRRKTNPPRMHDDNNFDCNGFYCYYENGNLKITNKKTNPYGFDRDGYYWELQEDGNRIKTDRKYDKNGFDIEGCLIGINPKGEVYTTTQRKNDKGFTQNDFYLYECYKKDPKSFDISKLELDKHHGFTCIGTYIDEDGIELGYTNKYGFDVDGYYHELLPDGSRNKESTGKVYDERGFDVIGNYHELLPDGSRKKTISLYDENGFNRDKLFFNGDEFSLYNERYFDYDGYYYQKENDNVVKTDKKYDENGFDLSGNYWKLVDGVYVNTNQPYNEDGIDYLGFNKDGNHSITGLGYDERYFRKNGVNAVTNTPYSIDGYNIHGVLYENHASTLLTEREHDRKLKWVNIAKRVFKLPAYKIELFVNEVESESKNKKELIKILYENILTAVAVDSESKDLYIQYIKDLIEEINSLTEQITEEKNKLEKDEQKINDLKKQLAYYKSIKKSLG